MSDWGKVLFYYDYERENKYAPNALERVKGVVSKSYKYPGTDGMILHALYGLNYFFKHYDKWYCDFNLGHSGWEEMNIAFDVLFDFYDIARGVDSVEQIMNNIKEINDIENYLVNCEGLYGWIFISYTGNLKDGHKLKYGYFSPGKERVIKSLKNALAEDGRWEVLDYQNHPEEAKELFDPMFEEITDKAILVASEKEFWDIGKKAAKYIKEECAKENRKLIVVK